MKKSEKILQKGHTIIKRPILPNFHSIAYHLTVSVHAQTIIGISCKMQHNDASVHGMIGLIMLVYGTPQLPYDNDN